jgi:hypothetical protein
VTPQLATACPGGHPPELAALDPFLAAALAKDPNNRFPLCTDFALALAEQAVSTRGSITPAAPTTPAPAPRRPSAAATADGPPGHTTTAASDPTQTARVAMTSSPEVAGPSPAPPPSSPAPSPTPPRDFIKLAVLTIIILIVTLAIAYVGSRSGPASDNASVIRAAKVGDCLHRVVGQPGRQQAGNGYTGAVWQP